MTFDGTLHYKYDAWNHLVAVNADDTANPGQPGDLVATYQYDGQGHRISKTVGTGESAVTTDYLYNENWQVVQENVNGVAKYLYVWDARYIDTPICRFDGSGNALYYTTDANNNVTSLVDGSTGEVVERYSYDPYGKVTFLKADWSLQDSQGSQPAGTASAYGNDILYCGYRYDPETGNYQVRNREYQPGLGVWMQRDPLGYLDGMSQYQYCRTDPANGLDPLGTFGIGDFKQAITDSITASAEKIYQFFAAHPELYTGKTLDFENSIADKLKVSASGVVDTNPRTAGWGDLFLSWLFEQGSPKWQFGPNDKTTLDMKKEPGVEEARQVVRTLAKRHSSDLGNDTQLRYDATWTYGVNEFWNSLRTANTAEEFIGSYSIHVEVTVSKPNEMQFTLYNVTGWESGTRFRKAAVSGGEHRAVIPNRDRTDTTGIHLGGNMTETWQWSEPICDK